VTQCDVIAPFMMVAYHMCLVIDKVAMHILVLCLKIFHYLLDLATDGYELNFENFIPQNNMADDRSYTAIWEYCWIYIDFI
jgi:hypothetical protein